MTDDGAHADLQDEAARPQPCRARNTSQESAGDVSKVSDEIDDSWKSSGSETEVVLGSFVETVLLTTISGIKTTKNG